VAAKAAGVVAQTEIDSLATTPSARAKEASQLFLDRAATPPHEEGNMPAGTIRLVFTRQPETVRLQPAR
jgi:hypothetical protein